MQAGSGEARRYALSLLLAGLSPEEVETHLEGRLVQQAAPTALTDPTNVLMKEVGTMAQPTERGPVDIMGVTTRSNNVEGRARKCTACPDAIALHAPYERVMRLGGKVEFYHPGCFESEFGERVLYGD